jgi:catechol 1,2-dioxygenase
MAGADRTDPAEITRQTLASFGGAPDARLREVLRDLVRHLHEFVVEVGLTHEEWYDAIDALTETGRVTDDHRQEFVLWSDTLGVSMLVDAIARELPEGTTESTVQGPFYVPDSPLRGFGEDIAEQSAGLPALVHGRVIDVVTGDPIAAAEVDVWQNGDNRLYAVQDTNSPEHHLRGRFKTRDDGSYAFRAVRPVPYPIPDDGPVGLMLSRTGRHPWRPAHIHLIVRAPGYHDLVTHVFDRDSDYLDSDAVFAVKRSLVKQFESRAADDPETPDGVDGLWCSLEFEIALAPMFATDETVKTDR